MECILSHVEPEEPEEPVRIELTDELDLHAFHPRDVAGLVADYLDHAREQGWREVRIVHGKGIGAVRETVHRVLAKHPAVLRFALGGDGRGGWGATSAWLRPASPAVTVRRLAPGDSFAGLTDMLHAAYAALAKRGMKFVASWQDEDETRRRCEGGETYVAEADGRIVGTVTCYPPGSSDGSPWYDRRDVASLGQWAVDPAWQGRGIGRRLLDAVEARARESGARHLALDTSERATELIATYERRGYAFVEHVQWRSTNYRSVVMSKPVGAAAPAGEPPEAP